MADASGRALQRAIVLLAALLALLLAAPLLLLWLLAEPAVRESLQGLLASQGGWLLLLWLPCAAGGAMLLGRWHRRWSKASARLLEQARVRTAHPGGAPLMEQINGPLQPLAGAFDAVLAERDALREEIALRVSEAAGRVERERQQLATLMAELNQSVVVCNRDGEILLYNQRARLQIRTLSRTPQLAGGAELLGLGRSIHSVLDPRLLDHALARLQRRLDRGAEQPSVQLMTPTRGGQWMRVHVGAVREPGSQTLAGYVLLLDNITRDFAAWQARDRQLLRYSERQRAALGSLQASLEVLELPDVPAPLRARLVGVVREELSRLTGLAVEMTGQLGQSLRSRWPLEDLLGSEFLEAVARRLQSAGAAPPALQDDATALWLHVDGYGLVESLAHVHGGLRSLGVAESDMLLRLAADEVQGRARLDLAWRGPEPDAATLRGWMEAPLAVGEGGPASTIEEVLERHQAVLWLVPAASGGPCLRLLLPLAESAPAVLQTPLSERPEFYDFDLFAGRGQARNLLDQPLEALRYVVFDTETTGLDPDSGDRIIQIGAVRIVNGRILHPESFEQLIDPGRPPSPASVAIHGIRAEELRGQARSEQVLPAFHAYCEGSVLVAHNAAFDLRFLQLEERRCGVRFDHPVLDTLLLSVLAQPEQQSHQLDAIAARFGLAFTARHRALGDAQVTADVLLRLIPLLRAQGLRTLGEVLEASRRTWHARQSF